MTTEEHNLLEYLNQQFPVTVGHLPLLEKIHAVWQSGMTSATQIMRHEINTCHGYSVGCQPCVARENSIVDIEQARDASQSPKECRQIILRHFPEPQEKELEAAKPRTSSTPKKTIQNINIPKCKGINCDCTDGLNHSPECRSEHNALCNEASMLDHINHGGWKCDFCGYNGQDNQQGNFFCARCAINK